MISSFDNLNQMKLSQDLQLNNMNNMKKIQQKLESPSHHSTLSFDQQLKSKSDRMGHIQRHKLNKREKKLYDTCMEMESLLWKQVLNAMRKTVDKYKLIDGGRGEEIFSDFLYDEYSKMMSAQSKTGITDTLYKQLSHFV
ncbi:MAG: rod-binding protein [Spirochaetes bacterium]|nr:rod-binding protein [Spirochaetota bacterium]